jgi:hypothetical protein
MIHSEPGQLPAKLAEYPLVLTLKSRKNGSTIFYGILAIFVGASLRLARHRMQVIRAGLRPAPTKERTM